MKKVLTLIIATVLLLAMTTTAFAAPFAGARGNGMRGNGYAGQCYNLMRDSDGNLVSKDVFESNLDKAISDGLIRAEDKAALIEMYDYCAENGGVGCGGQGMVAGGRGMGVGGMRLRDGSCFVTES